MEKRLELHCIILNLVGQSAKMNDLRNVITFAWMVVGLLLSKTNHLGQWGLQRASNAKAASKERQISRWLHNSKIKPKERYHPMCDFLGGNEVVKIEWRTTER
jgi:hypothetical protein